MDETEDFVTPREVEHNGDRLRQINERNHRPDEVDDGKHVVLDADDDNEDDVK